MKEVSVFISLKYLVVQKTKTLILILGILLTTAMIYTSAQVGSNLKESIIETSKSMSGYFHIQIHNAQIEKLNTLHKDVFGINRIGIAANTKVDINLGKDISMVYSAMDQEAINLLSLKLKEGAYPENSNEYCIEEWVYNSIEPKLEIGQESNYSISIDGKSEIIKGKLVGILQDTPWKIVSQGRQGIFLTSMSDIKSINPELISYSAYIELIEDKNLRDNIDNISISFMKDGAQVIVNDSIFDAVSSGGEVNYVVIAIIVLILLACIVFIFNVFNISMLERIKQIGLLRAIGASSFFSFKPKS